MRLVLACTGWYLAIGRDPSTDREILLGLFTYGDIEMLNYAGLLPKGSELGS